jgi:enediyne biosynthesis protein E4
VGDLFNTGALDVVVANQNGPLLLYENHVAPAEKWIEFSLEGTKSNRDAIGAEVTLYWNGKKQLQQVSGGCGFAAQNDLRLHFGLGKDPQIEKAVIHWPSGTIQTLKGLNPYKLYHIKEPL